MIFTIHANGAKDINGERKLSHSLDIYHLPTSRQCLIPQNTREAGVILASQYLDFDPSLGASMKQAWRD